MKKDGHTQQAASACRVTLMMCKHAQAQNAHAGAAKHFGNALDLNIQFHTMFLNVTSVAYATLHWLPTTDWFWPDFTVRAWARL